MKEDLIEHHDYEAVLPRVWDYLSSWHGFTDKERILRPVKFDNKRQCHYIDLYLENKQETEVLQTDSLMDESPSFLK